MLGKEALVVLTNLSRLIATNLEEPLSQVRGWVNGRIAIAVVRSHYRMIRGARRPSPLWDQEQDWDLGLGLGLTQLIVRQNNFVHTPANCFAACMIPPPPPSSAHRARAIIGYITKKIYGDLTMYVTGTVEDRRKRLA